MTVYVDVAPSLLEWAVSRAGWDAEAAMSRVPHLHGWLAGEKRPTLKQLERFAHATHAPLGMLFLPEPPVEEIPIPDMRTVRDAALREPSADLLDTIYICQRRQDWYRDYAIREGAEPLRFIASATLSTPPARVGAKFREQLQLDQRSVTSWSAAMRDLIDRIERLGVLVMVSGIVGSDTHRPLSTDEFRGFALCDPVAPVIFVNGADAKTAQIFTLAHELAHLALGHSALSDAALQERDSKAEERWCNAVAAEMLVPERAFTQTYQGSLAPTELDRLARLFRVSTLVILSRARETGLINWGTYQELAERERARIKGLEDERMSATTGGNYYNTQPLRLSREFSRAVIRDTREGATSYRDAYALLGTRQHSTFERLAESLGVA